MDKASEGTAGSAKPVRKFAIEPVETTQRSSKKTPEPVKPKRKFAPQLEETITRSHHRKAKPTATQETSSPSVQSTDRPRPRFAPQLVETSSRSRRKGDAESDQKHIDETDVSPGDLVHLPRHLRHVRPGATPLPPQNTPAASQDRILQAPESRFSYSNLSKRAPRKTSLRHPTLECINSDDSDEGNVPSLSHSTSSKSDTAEQYKHASRVRESCDERFSGYLLALAARVAERQLKDQAMAAYPNETVHEPVEHYAGDRDSDYSGEEGYGVLTENDAPQTYGRRESAAGWDLMEMRQHKESLEKQRQKRREEESSQKRTQGGALPGFKNPEAFTGSKALPSMAGIPLNQPGELKQMRDAAKPPMLGGGIVFPTCISPKQTQIDAYQRPNARKQTYTTISRQDSGLWTPGYTSPIITRTNSSAGLWNGVCQASRTGHCTPGKLLQTGLLTPLSRTPSKEMGDPMLRLAMTSKHQLPLSPTSPNTQIAKFNDMLDVEAKLDLEFPDSFVTQVYNYLSLGYPAIARDFDVELSKISKISMEEMRKDDSRNSSRGYVNMPEGDGSQENDIRNTCSRWLALRLYIREWGRQEGRMRADPGKGFGQAARRGSWLA